MAKMKIALDAGHGLYTAGRRCMADFDPAQTREWQLNDRILDRLQGALQAYSCEVMRVADTPGAQDIPLSARVAQANRWGANLYLSMHHNGGMGGKSGGGTVVYHDCTTLKGRNLADRLYERIVAETQLTGNRSAKVVQKAYYVLANTKMRAYLVENGFMDSSADTPVIITRAHADKTVQGLLQWLTADWGLAARPGGAEGTPEADGKDEPLTADSDPADLAPGAEVIVNGTIYGNGKGTGPGIAKQNARMYIVGYASDKYDYCWGVAKERDGIRQGWARAEDLRLVLAADESMIDGPADTFFPGTDYNGSSLIDALKAIGVESSFVHRAHIAAANEISGYRGSAAQNQAMLALLKAGQLVRP